MIPPRHAFPPRRACSKVNVLYMCNVPMYCRASLPRSCLLAIAATRAARLISSQPAQRCLERHLHALLRVVTVTPTAERSQDLTHQAIYQSLIHRL